MLAIFCVDECIKKKRLNCAKKRKSCIKKKKNLLLDVVLMRIFLHFCGD